MWVAYGPRGVEKLIETLDTTDAEVLRATLVTLNSLMSSQESKAQALSREPPLVPILGKLLGSEDDEVKRQAALTLASLGLLYQGRLAMSEAGTVGELSALVLDSSSTVVREAVSSM